MYRPQLFRRWIALYHINQYSVHNYIVHVLGKPNCTIHWMVIEIYPVHSLSTFCTTEARCLKIGLHEYRGPARVNSEKRHDPKSSNRA